MTQTYARLQKQIATLEAEAQKLKKAEVSSVIAKIKQAIAVYSLTPTDLFAVSAKRGKGRLKTGKRTGFKYADALGNTWVGMGKRPQWLRDALASGKSLEDFLVNGAAKPKAAGAATAPSPAGTRKKSKGAGKAKYRDGAGHSWSGFGPKPGWLKDAIAAGKTLDEFRV